MEDARSFGAVTFPFIGGLAAALLLSEAGGFRVLALLCAVLLTVQAIRMLLRGGTRTDVVLLFLCTGFCCAAASSLGGVIPRSGGVPLRAVSVMKTLLRSIPFADARTGALLTALLTGDRTDLPAATIAAFRSCGASHILALSGLHTGILYLMAGKMLSVAGNSPAARRLRSALILSLSLFYTLMTGLSPSLVRAFLFILIHEICLLGGRRQPPWRTLLVALTLQAAFSPSQVVSIGFQLSYLAMTGITLLYPRMAAWYPSGGRYNPLRRIWNGVALAVSCQVTTAPAVWLYFGTFPRHFLLTNLLALPLTTALVMLGVVTATLTALGMCPAILLTLTDAAARALLFCLDVIAGM